MAAAAGQSPHVLAADHPPGGLIRTMAKAEPVAEIEI
jgi:hypothetical protein